MRVSFALALGFALVFAIAAHGQTERVLRPWGEEQATGRPNTTTAGDQRTAWASATPDGQDEWLELEYAADIEPTTILVYETFNPGALGKVSGFTPSGMEAELWSGEDPTEPGAGIGVSEVKVSMEFKTKRIRLYLNSKNVSGWNEIDAVGLKDKDGEMHWAVKATASSCFASKGATTGIGALGTYDVSDLVLGGVTPVVISDADDEPAEDLTRAVRDPRDERIEKLETEVRELRAAVKALRADVEKQQP